MITWNKFTDNGYMAKAEDKKVAIWLQGKTCELTYERKNTKTAEWEVVVDRAIFRNFKVAKKYAEEKLS